MIIFLDVLKAWIVLARSALHEPNAAGEDVGDSV
jgi:hypothetical protein